jgi:uncharacterized protein (TIGR01777 family)
MWIAITGASGLVGSALAEALTADGHRVTRLVRRAPRGADELRWDPRGSGAELPALSGVEAVVHLAGVGVGEQRWTPAYKAEIRDSRVIGTTTLATALADLDKPPSVLVSASGTGFYGDTGDAEVDESTPLGDDFLALLCRDWEAATQPAQEAGIRVAHIRTGLVAAAKGGAFGRRILPLFKLGLGGRLGTGRQYWCLISLRDEVAAIRHLIETETAQGPFNLVCPEPATNRDVTAALGKALHRPTVLPAPAWALRLVVGEFAEIGVLAGQRAMPRRLLESGFAFADPTIEAVIERTVAPRQR